MTEIWIICDIEDGEPWAFEFYPTETSAQDDIDELAQDEDYEPRCFVPREELEKLKASANTVTTLLEVEIEQLKEEVQCDRDNFMTASELWKNKCKVLEMRLAEADALLEQYGAKRV